MTITNPSAGNVYFDRDGSAISSTTQPNRDGGAISNATEATTVNTRIRGVTPGDPIIQAPGVVGYSGVAGMVTGVQGAVAVPYEPTREFVIKGYSTTLGGTATTGLQFPGSDFGNTRNPIHVKESWRTTRVATAIRNNQWSDYTGGFMTLPTAATDSFGADHAGRPSGEVPGELAYEYGNASGWMEDYQRRELW